MDYRSWGKNRDKKSTFPAEGMQKNALDKRQPLRKERNSRAATLTETSYSTNLRRYEPRKGLPMHTFQPCAQHPLTRIGNQVPSASTTDFSAQPEREYIPLLRYQVIPAGKNFFHIQEISTGRIRGFRRLHREACALARHLEELI
nr:hypothetical protein [Pseudomonas sp. Irchel 3E20]